MAKKTSVLMGRQEVIHCCRRLRRLYRPCSERILFSVSPFWAQSLGRGKRCYRVWRGPANITLDLSGWLWSPSWEARRERPSRACRYYKSMQNRRRSLEHPQCLHKLPKGEYSESSERPQKPKRTIAFSSPWQLIQRAAKRAPVSL